MVGHGNATQLCITQANLIEFQDGFIQEYLDNTMVENIYLFIHR